MVQQARKSPQLKLFLLIGFFSACWPAAWNVSEVQSGLIRGGSFCESVQLDTNVLYCTHSNTNTLQLCSGNLGKTITYCKTWFILQCMVWHPWHDNFSSSSLTLTLFHGLCLFCVKNSIDWALPSGQGDLQHYPFSTDTFARLHLFCVSKTLSCAARRCSYCSAMVWDPGQGLQRSNVRKTCLICFCAAHHLIFTPDDEDPNAYEAKNLTKGVCSAVRACCSP